MKNTFVRVGVPVVPIGSEPRMTTETPAVAARTAAPAAAVGLFTDQDLFARMLDDDQDIETLLRQVSDRHTLDMSGPALSSLTRALVTAEMLRNEIRLYRNYLGVGA